MANVQLWTLFLEPLVSGKNLGRSHSAEKHVRILLAMEESKSRPLMVLSESAQIFLRSLVFSTPPTHARSWLLVSESLLLCVFLSPEEYRNNVYWEMFERFGSLRLRTAGVHGWLQMAVVGTAVSKQTSSFPQRAISTSSLWLLQNSAIVGNTGRFWQ